MYCVNARVDGLVVHLHDGVALLAIGFLRSGLHEVHRLVNRHHVRQLKERGLQDCVRALAHADLNGFVDGVDRIKLNVVVCNIFLRLCI